MQPEPTNTERKTLVEAFSELPDPRVRERCDHLLHEVLVIAVCGMLVGGESFYDMEDFASESEGWLRGFLSLPGGVPRHDTFNRVFQALCPRAFGECFARWTQGVRERLRGGAPSAGGEVVALDGKALRRAKGRGQEARVIVSAWATEHGLALGQSAVADKSNEITAVPELLRALELAGCIVTLDALHCQKNTAREIHEADADWVLALKGNQGAAHGEVRAFLDDAIERDAPGLVKMETVEKGHGRIEIRRYWQSGDIGWFADRAEWENLHSVGVVEAVREVGGSAPSTERRYYLSSLPPDIAKFARAVRGHWAVENQLHWSLDVSFDEDGSRARTRHAATNLATLRRIALNLLRADKSSSKSLNRKRLRAALVPAYLLSLLKF